MILLLPLAERADPGEEQGMLDLPLDKGAVEKIWD
jgi:hypothetical protein